VATTMRGRETIADTLIMVVTEELIWAIDERKPLENEFAPDEGTTIEEETSIGEWVVVAEEGISAAMWESITKRNTKYALIPS